MESSLKRSKNFQQMSISALAFDYGLRNIGLAYGQSLTRHVKELTPLKAKDGMPDWDAIALLLKEWKPSFLIIGLPLNMNGTESELSQRARKFGRRLRGYFDIHIEFMDERLSTFDAKIEAKSRGYNSHRNKLIDSIAARLILESWFSQS